jgi:hypothetical protein
MEELDMKQIEQIRQENELHVKSKEELEALRSSLSRRIRHMENYDWDVVQESYEENQKGFWKEIDSLEILIEVINLELSRRS